MRTKAALKALHGFIIAALLNTPLQCIRCQKSDKLGAYLAKFPYMTHLNLNHSAFKARADTYQFSLAYISETLMMIVGALHTCLGSLIVEFCELQGEWMSHLQGLAKLESLHLAGGSKFGEEHFRCSTQAALHLS